MKFNPSPLSVYATEHSTGLNEILTQLDRETNLTKLLPQMICGKLVGGLLRMISHLRRPKSVLEIGTFTGYSAICLAEGMPKDGELITIEINPEHASIQKKYLELSGHLDKVKFLVGDAREIISGLNQKFDLIFIDADKEHYPVYFKMLKPLLSENGLLIADNVLWAGKVVEPKEQGKETSGIRAFNKLVQDDPEVENVLLPFHDGLMLVRKLASRL